MKRDKIFVSHSSKDIELVESFVENVLRLGLDIPAERIFCSSMEGQGVESGQYIPDRLRDEIRKSLIALLFISKSYKDSEVCQNELGAAWAELDKENVIAVLLPDTNFNNVGFLQVGKLGISLNERSKILRLIQDKKEELNPSFDLAKLHDHIETFLKKLAGFPADENIQKKPEVSEEMREWKRCFTDSLEPFDDLIRQVIPTLRDGIHQISDVHIQNNVLEKFSRASFLKDLWYKQAGGDYYVEKLRNLPSGNWLMSTNGWEIKISSMWLSMNVENQYEFVLFRSEALPPYQIQSDVKGESYYVGILPDGTIISENERLNGYTIIHGQTIDLSAVDVEPRYRESESHWVFLVTDYHKLGFNPDQTIDFCRKLDKGEVEVTADNLLRFIRHSQNHPTVMQWR